MMHHLESLIQELPIGLLLFDSENCLVSANTLGQEHLSCFGAVNIGECISQIGTYPLIDLLDRQEDPLPVELVATDDSGRRFEIRPRAVVGDDTIDWLLVIRDVTTEREIQERIHLQDRLATVGQLAAGIAHDFNNIMSAILIYADLLQADSNMPDSAKDRLAIIHQQVQRASSLIKQMLDFSRRSVMEQSELDLLPFLKEIETLLRRMLPETIQIELIYQSGEYKVFIDATRIQQVLMNLAVNARDAMPDGGVIQFELEALHFDEGDPLPSIYLVPGDWIRLTTRDTGIGIPPENLPRIFEPFYTTKPVGKGTGLGLAQVYGIVKQHGGFIDVESQLGEGTAFHIYLPRLLDKLPDQEEIESAILLDGSDRLVVLAEDDAPTRSAVKAMLEASHFEVLTAKNGVEALELLKVEAQKTVLLVSDVVMPLMGGVELYEEIRQQWPWIKVIFMTGHPLEGKSGSLLSKSDVPWLQKPFTVQQFQQVVRQIFEDV